MILTSTYRQFSAPFWQLDKISMSARKWKEKKMINQEKNKENKGSQEGWLQQHPILQFFSVQFVYLFLIFHEWDFLPFKLGAQITFCKVRNMLPPISPPNVCGQYVLKKCFKN